MIVDIAGMARSYRWCFACFSGNITIVARSYKGFFGGVDNYLVAVCGVGLGWWGAQVGFGYFCQGVGSAGADGFVFWCFRGNIGVSELMLHCHF